MKANILLIEDDDALAMGLEFLFKQEGMNVTRACDCKSARAAFSGASYDLIVLDITLPDGNGFDLCRDFRASSDTPILFLTALDDELSQVRALDGGGDDYVTKPFNPLELVARVKSQLRRYTKLGNLNTDNNAVFRAGGLVINDETKEVTVDGEPVKLTPIEYNILLLLVRNQGRVFSINQIYESIWEEEAIGADNTVAVHIRHIREKIEINPKEPRYLKVVWGVGYKIEKQP